MEWFFKKPNPFPKSIFENIAYGPKIHGLTNSKSELDDIVKESLIKAGLWSEVSDRLFDQGTSLSVATTKALYSKSNRSQS